MEPEKIFSDEPPQPAGSVTTPNTPSAKPPRPKLPFWLWLIIVIGAAAIAVILVLLLGGIKLQSVDVPGTPEVGMPTATPIPEDMEIVITSPRAGETVSNPVTVTGRGRAFENTIMLRVKDSKGNVLAQTFVTANAPDIGEKGDFSKEISFTKPASEFGTIEAYEESAKDGSEDHLYSVDVHFSEWTASDAGSGPNIVFVTESGTVVNMYDSNSGSVVTYEPLGKAEFGASVAATDTTAYAASGNDERSKVEVTAIDLESQATENIFTLDPEGHSGIVPVGLAASPSGDSLAISVGYMDENFEFGESAALYKVFTYNIVDKELVEVYAKESEGIYFVSQVEDWSRANELFVYEFIGDALAGAYGETIKINADNKEAINLSSDYNVLGMSRVSPDGKKVAFTELRSENLEVEEDAIVLLDLETGDKSDIYTFTQEGSEMGMVLEIGDFHWGKDGQTLVWGTADGEVKMLDINSGDVEVMGLGKAGTVTEILQMSDGTIIVDFVPESGAASEIISLDPTTGTSSIMYSSAEDYIDLIEVF